MPTNGDRTPRRVLIIKITLELIYLEVIHLALVNIVSSDRIYHQFTSNPITLVDKGVRTCCSAIGHLPVWTFDNNF